MLTARGLVWENIHRPGNRAAVFGQKVFIQCFQASTSRTKTSTQGGFEPPSVASAKSSQTLDSNALSIRRLGPCQRQTLATKIDSNSS